MCSIFGIINQTADEKRENIIRAMAQDQSHRGPDDGGFFEDANIAFGHRRLSVIDLSSQAHQPMCAPNNDIVLIFNGEIYNYEKLRDKLITLGHTFTSSSDTECIIHCYEEYGTQCFSMLDGMFALAIYDKHRKQVIFARDRMGKKPLFYFISGKAMVFASELSALKLHPDMPAKLNMQSVSDYLSLLYIPCPATIYENVFKAVPGEYMIFDINSGSLLKERFFKIDCSLQSDLSFDESAARLRELLFSAVKKRLIADVPVGVFLSGGVDSTIVASIMAELRAPQQTEAFTIGFEDPVYDERIRARHAALFINEKTGNSLLHHEKIVSPSDFSIVKKLIKHYGEPYADASMMPTSLLSRFTRERVTVALSGDGADELFAGYDRYFLMSKIHYFNIIPYHLRRFIFRCMAGMIPSGSERSRHARIKRAFDVISCRENQQYYRIIDRSNTDFKRQLAGENLKANLDSLKQNSILELFDNLSSKSVVNKYLEFDQKTYLVGDILTKTDIASMADSLELRSPFLDRDVVAFANSLPIEYKLHGKDKKHILKHAFKDIIPQSVLTDNKKGFGVPIANYLREAWHDEAENILFHSEKMQQSGIFNTQFLQDIWQKHQSGRFDYSYQLWTVLLFGLFLENEV